MKKHLFLLLAAWLLMACGGGGDPEQQPTYQQLATPEPSVTLEGNKATVRWAAIEHANAYDYELQRGDESPETGTAYSAGYRFDVENGVRYSFRVKAVPPSKSAWLESEWSSWVEISNNMLQTPSPRIVEGSLTDQAITFEWEAVEGASGYSYELLEETGSQPLLAGEVAETSLYMAELTPGKSYRFRLKALASGGKEDSAWSAYVDFTTRTVESLAAPQPQLGRLTTTSVALYWEAVEGAVSYEVACYEEGSLQAALWFETTSACEVVIEELREAAAYQLQVRALADEGDPYMENSPWSEWLHFTTRTPSSLDLGLPVAGENDGVLRAFPGAEGGGMYTTGGRGGKVYHVTNLNDSGEGSLRWAINQSGARTIVFDVAGTIQLKSTLIIRNGDLTIAGQTAPGDGICLRDYSVQLNANNVIIRYMRFRMGDEAKQENDAIWGRYYSDIILDHCSMSWSTDECSSFYGNKNFTMQWCLLGESLRNSVHGKGSHGYGGIWGGKNASFHHNLLTSHSSRNPRFDHPQIYDSSNITTHRGHVDYRNNVVYNWGDNSSYGGEGGWYNMVGNYYKPGPASKQRKYFVDANSYYSSGKTQYDYPRLYLEGNYHAGSYAEELNSDNWKGVYWHDGTGVGDYAGAKLSHLQAIRKDDTQSCYTSTHTAQEAFDQVLSWVGASLRRDAVDSRLSGDARDGKATYTSGGNGSTGGIIDTQSAVGGWPALSATSEEIARASTDTDKDGIPDYYENLFGLDPANGADAAAVSLDPQGIYPNLEVYLHYLVREITEAQKAGSDYLRLE